MPDSDVCLMRKSGQPAHPKTADHKVRHPFQLVSINLMGPINIKLGALEGYKHVRKISDKPTKWTEAFLLKSKSGVFSVFYYNRLCTM